MSVLDWLSREVDSSSQFMRRNVDMHVMAIAISKTENNTRL